MFFVKVLPLLVLGVAVRQALGHGMMLDPINRSSIWRVNDSFPINWNDNENFCGGFAVQWQVNGGKCGVCGDNYQDPVPRKNENTGTYGLGYIVKQYKAGSVIDIHTRLTANHKGWFNYSLCKLVDSSKPETDACFVPLQFEDGSYQYAITSDMREIYNRVVLPPGVTCDHCVLRWNYKCGNSWGICEDGTGAIGCGDQEHFRSCSDIAIVV